MDSHALTPQATQRLRQIADARRALLGDGALTGTTRVEPWIERSWRRCLAQGLRPDQRIGFDVVSPAAVGRAREAHQPLLRAAAPVIRSLARTMADTGYFAILTDAHGVVIDVNGPVDHGNRLAHLIARVGVDLSESAVGTTAIGATLAEHQAVWLHRGEHFFEDTSAYSCAGAPVFGPDGRCMGMLDLTGVHVPEYPALRHLVMQSAIGIENALVLAQHHHLLLRLSWPGQVPGGEGDGLVVVDTDGLMTGINRNGAHMLGLTTGAPWPHCSEVFAVPYGSLFDAGTAQRSAIEVPLWSGLRVQVLARLNDGLPIHTNSRSRQTQGVPLKDLEEALIRTAVDNARGNVMEAARTLGISRATVYRKLNRKRG